MSIIELKGPVIRCSSQLVSGRLECSFPCVSIRAILLPLLCSALLWHSREIGRTDCTTRQTKCTKVRNSLPCLTLPLPISCCVSQPLTRLTSIRAPSHCQCQMILLHLSLNTFLLISFSLCLWWLILSLHPFIHLNLQSTCYCISALWSNCRPWYCIPRYSITKISGSFTKITYWCESTFQSWVALHSSLRHAVLILFCMEIIFYTVTKDLPWAFVTTSLKWGF